MISLFLGFSAAVLLAACAAIYVRHTFLDTEEGLVVEYRADENILKRIEILEKRMHTNSTNESKIHTADGFYKDLEVPGMNAKAE